MIDFLRNLLGYIVVVGAVYLFLTVCNWDFNPSDWNGFSRFIIGLWGLISIKIFLEEWY